MALYLIDTKDVEVVNIEDDCVSFVNENGDEDDRYKWYLKNDLRLSVKDGATVIRVRALTGLEIECMDQQDKNYTINLALKSIHKDDVKVFNELPWVFRSTLGGFVYKVSTNFLM